MSQLDPAWEVSVEEVKQMLDDGRQFLLLDVRQPEEHAVVRIDGARLVPLNDLPTALPSLEGHADQVVVTYCHMGGRSLQAAAFLRQQGFAHVRSMAGGMEAWSARIAPSQPRY